MTQRQETVGSGSSALSTTIAYTFDNLGRLSQMQYPNGVVATYGYADGEVISLRVAVGNQTLPVITAAHRVGETHLTWQLTHGTGLIEDKRYDQDGLLRSLNVGDSTHTLEQHSYDYDLASQLKQLSDSVQ